MTSDDVVAQALDEHATLVGAITEGMRGEIARLAERVLDAVENGGTLMFCGNGGSAADAQHLAAEYVIRFGRERRALAAIALTTDTSVLTAGGNDYGFDTIFERQVRGLARKGDMLLLHSTSGESENLLRAAAAAREMGVATAALLAKGGGRLAGSVDQALVVPTQSTARAQEAHLMIGHIVCEFVDRAVAGSDGGRGGAA